MEDGKLELTTITKSITHHLDNCRLFRQFSQSSFQHKYYHQTISFGPQKATNICTDTPLHGARKKARQTEGLFRQSDRQTDRETFGHFIIPLQMKMIRRYLFSLGSPPPSSTGMKLTDRSVGWTVRIIIQRECRLGEVFGRMLHNPEYANVSLVMEFAVLQ